MQRKNLILLAGWHLIRNCNCKKFFLFGWLCQTFLLRACDSDSSINSARGFRAGLSIAYLLFTFNWPILDHPCLRKFVDKEMYFIVLEAACEISNSWRPLLTKSFSGTQHDSVGNSSNRFDTVWPLYKIGVSGHQTMSDRVKNLDRA